MGRRAALLSQTDYVRAIRAAQQCGAGAVDFMIDGTIRIHMSPVAISQADLADEGVVAAPPRIVVF